jgi:hypothetical protein
MASKERSAGRVHAGLKALIGGLPNMPPGITAVTVLGNTYTLPDLGTKLSSYAAKYATAETLTTQAKVAVDARDAEAAEAREFLSATKGAIKNALGRKSPALQTVGVTPEKTPAPPTAEEKQQRVAKAKATREARHTMGKKQKAKIKGQVPPAPGNGG